jgi:hypothetical protein
MQMGHYLGLEHTHHGDCSATNDGVDDTPANLNAQTTKWSAQLTNQVPVGFDCSSHFYGAALLNMMTAGESASQSPLAPGPPAGVHTLQAISQQVQIGPGGLGCCNGL